jgi:acetolactate synthase-1/2/3 large subunit
VLMLGGTALSDAGLVWAGRLAAATGARLFAQQSSGRIARGAGRVPVEKTPNGVDAAAATFAGCDLLVCVGARPPVGFFGYPGKPATGLPEDCQVVSLASSTHDLIAALQLACDSLGVASATPVARSERRSIALPTGRFDGGAVIQTVASLLPDGAILCDESISSGFQLFALTDGTAPHDYLPLTGGAIGIGPPLATGAAIASPDRKVVCLQADGSGMYTAQALWTQARERLDVVTVVFANRSYALLHRELRAVGVEQAGQNAIRMLDMTDPAIDWVKLAESMGVEACRVESAVALSAVFSAALQRPGPMLIEAVIDV